MAVKTKGSISRKRVSKPSHHRERWPRINEPGGQYSVRRSKDDARMPSPGPSNIIVRTPNPLPPPRDVESQ